MKPVSHSDPSKGGRASTVLVICESEALRLAVELSLSLAGHRVTAAANAQAGLSAFTAVQPQLVVVQSEWQEDDVVGDASRAAACDASWSLLRAALGACPAKL